MQQDKIIYDIAVIGAGAAGCMAAIRAGELGIRAVLLERNPSIGRKILITGNGRCNLTNTAQVDVFIKGIKPNGEFFRSAFHAFSNEALMEFFRSCGLGLKVEGAGCVFPVTDDAHSVVAILEARIRENKVEAAFNHRAAGIEKKDGVFVINSEGTENVKAKKVIITTGGASYSATGSTGDGFRIAEIMGHTIAHIMPALVPLVAREKWVSQLQGVSLETVRIVFGPAGKRKMSDTGNMIFTHFGISGPLVLDISGQIVSALESDKEAMISIDLKPAVKKEQLEQQLADKLSENSKAQIKNIMQWALPKAMTGAFLALAGVQPDKRANQITKEDRRVITGLFKELPLTITGSLPLENAMVTAGGVSIKEINPRTMESRIVKGLYFAGEVIEGAAPSGGYNLQQAFSTGYLAGESAATAT